jgi:hypothetical protein
MKRLWGDTNHKNIACTGNMTSSLKKLHQVMKLAMNVTTYSHRAVHRLYIGLFNQYLLHLPKNTPLCYYSYVHPTQKFVALDRTLNTVNDLHFHLGLTLAYK